MSGSHPTVTGKPDSGRGFSFDRLGDSYHFSITDHVDLEHVLELDEALWIATTAPISTLKTDKTFLHLLDSDQDGRLRAEEIKDGIRHLFATLTDRSTIRAGHTTLPLAAIDQDSELGRRIRGSAEKVLKRLGIERRTIDLAQVRAIKEEVLGGGLDQAGVVLPEATADTGIGQFIADIIATTGGAAHPCGRPGVDQKSLEAFLEQCRRYLDWRREAGRIGSEERTEILVLGSATDGAYQSYQRVRDKLHQYFLLCDIKRLNPDLLERALNNPEVNLAYNLIRIEDAESYLGSAPLALLSADGCLDLGGEINPYFAEALRSFGERAATPLLGAQVSTLDKHQFATLQQLLKPYERWLGRKPEVTVEGLGEATISDYVSNPDFRKTLEALIEESHRTAIVLENLTEVERVILYQAHMLPLVNSFVSFPYLYDPDKRALFEEGTLIMDGRHFTMAVKVDDRQHHIDTCRSSNIFVLYCELFGKEGSRMHEIAVPVTAGSRGTLHLNKWGIFNDLDGNELHAKVVDIVENPISVKEAVTDPFVRIKNSLFSRMEQFSSKAEEQLFRKKEQDKDQAKDTKTASLLGGGGLAVAALGSSLAFITKTLSSMSLRTVLLALLVIVVLIVVPTAISAYARLSRRDLRTILEGAGWGLNCRMKLTPQQAAHFTRKPVRPQKG